MSRVAVGKCLLAVSVLWAGGRLAAQDDKARQLTVTVGKSLVIDSPVNIQRVSVGNNLLAEATAVTPRELLINAKAPGETTLIMWEQGGRRVSYDITVRPSGAKLQVVRDQITGELAGQDITVEVSGDNVILRGNATDLVSAERAAAIAGTYGKVVNLLHVAVPPVETQILLKVRFANVDRSAVKELGVNLANMGATNTIAGTTTGQFAAPKISVDGPTATLSVADALNVFLFRRDLNLAATIRALQNSQKLELLAEPNVLAINGKPASFVAGGEFPFPTLQGGGGGVGQVTIAFREFGVRINFLPTVTPRGTVRLQVTPEVSSLDYANALTLYGYTIPALSTRRVQTEVELEDGQSFAIAGLLDNRTTETLNKVPGLGDIPLLGKLFQSRATKKSNSELLIMVTPEIVRPIPKGQPLPQMEFPTKFMEGTRTEPPRTPGMDVTGPVPVNPPQATVPVEQLQLKASPAGGATAVPALQLVPLPYMPVTQPLNPGLNPSSAAPATTPAPGGSGK